MARLFRMIALSLLVTFTAAGVASRAQAASPDLNLGYFNGLAMNGYDVMTYWRGGDPQKGAPEISADFNGATWVFLNEGNRQAFLSDPVKFAPQFGGYCAYAASQNAVADVEPYAWRIWDSKLYLNYSPQVRRIWASDIDANIEKANGHWPELLQQ